MDKDDSKTGTTEGEEENKKVALLLFIVISE